MIKKTFKNTFKVYKNFLNWNLSKTYAIWISFMYSIILVTPLLIAATFIFLSKNNVLESSDVDYTALTNVPWFIPLAILLFVWFFIFLVISSYKSFIYYKISKSLTEDKPFDYPKKELLLIIIWFLVVSIILLFNPTFFWLLLVILMLFFIPSLIKNWKDLLNYSKLAIINYTILLASLIGLFLLTIPFSFFSLDKIAIFIISTWLIWIWLLYLRLEFSYIKKIENPELSAIKSIKEGFSSINWNFLKFMITYIITMLPFTPLIILNLAMQSWSWETGIIWFILWLMTFLLFWGVHQMIITTFYKNLKN